MKPATVRLVSSLALMASAAAIAVETSGKQVVDMVNVPKEVLEVILATHPDFEPASAERETRDGRRYYDVEGANGEGAEIEFDLVLTDGSWRIVEIQRDIAPEQAPAVVLARLTAAQPDFRTNRIIESDQGDGTVIYEFFGASSDGEDRKIEVRYAEGKADVLTEEWMH